MRLPHYLRKHRKCNGLSQKDVAFLLGNKSSAKVSRYEHYARYPTLKTALALSVIYDISPQELFPGLILEINKNIRNRSEKLYEDCKNTPKTKKLEHKQKHLSKLKSL